MRSQKGVERGQRPSTRSIRTDADYGGNKLKRYSGLDCHWELAAGGRSLDYDVWEP